MTTNALILGFNSPSAVCSASNSILCGAGSGVVARRGADSIQWVPGDGRYPVGKLAYSHSSRLLCVTEVRLNVTLLVFRYPEYNRVQKIDNIAKVDVQDMCFSPNGQMLAILTSMPSCIVNLFFVQRGRSLEKAASVSLDDKFWKQMVFPPQRTDCIAVLEPQGVAIASQLSLTTTLPSIITLASQQHEFCSFSWTPSGVVCGTKGGSLVIFDELKMEMQDYLTCPTTASVTSILGTPMLLLLGTEEGSVFGYNTNTKELQLLLQVNHFIERMSLSENGFDTLVVSKADVRKLDLRTSSSTLIRARNTGDTVKIMTLENLVVMVCADGTLARYEADTNTVTRFVTDFNDRAEDACALQSSVVVVFHSGCVRCFTSKPEFKLSSHIKLGSIPLSLCASDGDSSLVVTDGNTIHLLTVKNDLLYFQSSVDTFTSKVTNLRWILGNDRSVLAACVNGEVQLVRCFDGNDLQPSTLLVETIWRLDYPVRDILPLYFDEEVVNILVHSLDKETKLYVLERRREREVKSLRPLFLMRDHESGGTTIERFGNTAVISGGSDGKVVIRDVSHYQSKLTPIPPSKEKRRPLQEILLRPFGKRGIVSISVWNEEEGFVCAGEDTVVHLIPQSGTINYSWTEPEWHEERPPSPPKEVKTIPRDDAVMAEESKRKILSSLTELRTDINKLLVEKTSAVNIEEFLLPDQRESFIAECDLAIQQAKEDDYYHLLHNEFTQYKIRRECWDTMEIQRTKIVTLNKPILEVHNFHRRKTNPEAVGLLKKVKFLRMLQIKAGDYFTFSSQVKHPESKPQMTQLETDLNDDTTELLYDPIDVYTNSRATIQMILLNGRISKVKETFNVIFDNLKEKKNSELTRIQERNDRCKRIMRQLGEPISDDLLFTPYFDKEEDPSSVFEVFDSEIDPELLKLAKKEDNSAYAISSSDEAALKTWMDGLEKDIEVIAVKVPLPAFADESLEQYVPPDERTDEQIKIYEEYEKELAEQTANVNERKEALRKEMKDLMKANVDGANRINEEISSLGKRRMDAAQLVDELESHQVNALQRLLLEPTICNELLAVIKEKTELEGRLKQLQSLEAYKKKLLSIEELNLQKSIEDEKTLATEMHNSPPFNDTEFGDRLYRRFTKWRSKYEEGLAVVPQVGQHEHFPEALWELYCKCCSKIVEAKDVISRNTATVCSFTELLKDVETEMVKVQNEVEEKEAAEDACRDNAIRRILNVQNLYSLRQGQVQDEDAVVGADFVTFSFRWASDILNYNSLVFSSFDELRRLMTKISQQRQAMKMCAWETERLQYCVGTLEMELRQLHTLRVTRQMQDIIHTGVASSGEDELEKLNRRIEYVRQVMSKKIEERNRVIARLKLQINDRNVENKLLDTEVQQIKSIVDDKKAVWTMLGEHNNEEDRLRQRMRELYENSELEELARSQQEELVRLKREIDRLRERTFPSFAVVSKKTVS
ncbi:WD repeat-containing protein 96 [Trypanosoma theileri]|uniref:Cilia- and flagella-associated protein 43 n=1 Tax=Trypanosoma theileri TaxID=67003 RepID=A0A1X0NIE3_9TRYP|nr:WD repeat-containing protein 96 [Trypanosoma theileri]ORC84456.1 WD repeat-containing protein 96 [Trypanosoma theileri]